MDFRSLWSIYIHAWPFQALHAWVLLLVSGQLVGGWREVRYLDAWKSGDTSLPLGLLLARVEGRRASPDSASAEGVQSAVEDRIERLQTYVTFFLLIGIAGTFFGMLTLVQANPAEAGQLQSFLTRGLRSALPIGFFGVILTIAGQLVSAHLASRLRNASTHAIARALPPATVDAFVDLAERMGEAVQLLRTSLSPLAGIEEAMTRSLIPIVDKLDASLASSLRAQAEHMASVAGIIADFRGTLSELKQPIVTISGSAQAIEQSFKGLEGLMTAMETTVDRRADAMSRLELVMAETIKGIDASAGELRKFPGDLNVAMNGAFAQVTDAWMKQFGGYTRDMSVLLSESNRKVTVAAQEASQAIVSATGSLENFSHNAGARLTEGIDKGAETLRAALADFSRSFKTDFPDAIDAARVGIDVGLGRMGQMTEGLKTLAALTESVRRSLDGWSESRSALAQVTRQLQASARELKEAAAMLSQIHTSHVTLRWPTKWPLRWPTQWPRGRR